MEMGNPGRHWWALLRAVVTALLIAALAQTAAAATRTISNTALLQWTAGGTETEVSSNRVDLEFASEVVLETFTPTNGLLPPAALASSCVANGASASGGGQPTPLADMPLTPTQDVYVGRPVVLSFTSAADNRDPNGIDTVTGTVRTSSGDSETVTFTESGPNTGLFLAVIETVAMPPAPTAGDCRLSVAGGTTVIVDFGSSPDAPPIATSSLNVLVDPFGITFDSRDGAPLAGVKVTLIDTATGKPAAVYSDDSVSRFPASVVTGQPTTDSGGTTYAFPAGDYRFPLVAPGTYRMLVEAVSPYTFPSVAAPAQIAALHRPDGQPFTIAGGSYGKEFVLTAAGSVRLDLPLDRPVTPLIVTKTVGRGDAQSGDLVVYQVEVRNPGAYGTGPITVADHIPAQMRYRASTARVDGKVIADPVLTGDRTLRFALPPLGAGARALLRYVLEVRPNASTGDALNEAQASADGVSSNVSDAVVRIHNDNIADRVTIIGRVLGGGCGAGPSTARGVPGIRVMLEDGSYAVTDYDGRYHFEGLKTGTHVVQLDRATIPDGAEAVDCEADVRSGGRGTSRFVEGFGGALKRADFRLAPATAPLSTGASTAIVPRAEPSNRAVLSDAAAAGGDRDWLVGQTPGTEFLFPAADSNPRSPVTRVVVKHAPGEKLILLVNGKPADSIAFEGTRKAPAGDVAISAWRGIPLADRSTELAVEVRDDRGVLVKTLRRTVVFANVPANVELLRDRSRLIADGIHRPVLALRVTDRSGHPVHQGLAGEFELPDPYYPAVEADAQQARQLAGLERARPTWHVVGDDGIAFVELEPTTASGTVSMRFEFRDGRTVREERLEAWLSPGDRPWTIVGLAEGTVGFNRLDKHLQALGPKTPKNLTDGRLALYAKGQVLGRWLLTLAYDSDKHRRDERFGGVIDPQQYYTVYADRSERRYDAASIRKLYIRLERPQFYALFGDYTVALDEPVLAHYVRSLNGAKAEYQSSQVSAVGFASQTPLTHRREEIQGNGVSGPYALRNRLILANSERVTLETRDRFRSEKIIEQRLLARHIDYDIDYERGTLIFRSPVLSRSSSLDPQFIIVEYDVDGIARSALNAGGRVSWRSRDQRVKIGATLVNDNDGETRTDLAGADARVRVTATTEVRAEVAASRPSERSSTGTGTATAWLLEVEHRNGRFDALAYAGQRDLGFGLGQTNAVENGHRKVGIDARWHVSDSLAWTASAWHDIALADGARRDAARVLGEYRRGDLSAHAGLTFARDQLADDRTATSTLLVVGASKQLAHARVELGVDSEIPLGNSDDSVDFPSRHRLTARFAATRWASLIGSYEIAKGGAIDARTARLGFDLAPWAGARIALSGNVQQIPEFGRRSFGALGLAQSLILSKHWSVDLSLDSNKTIGGIDPARVINPLQPVASGGYIGDGSILTEDFTAVTAGATYRSGRLSVTGRGEYRRGEQERRTGLIFGALRQIGEGRALAGGINWFRAEERGGAVTSVADANLTWANRPANTALTWLDKFELRRDAVTGAIAGSADPLGNPLSITGDARSVRMINALTMNYSTFDNCLEMSVFWGARYVSDRYGDDDIAGWSNVLAGDARWSIGRAIEVGAAASIRSGVAARSAAYSFGPQFSVKPFPNALLMLGYNVAGYRDRDFAADRFTRSGAYATLRFKFDELSLADFGLERRR